MARKVKELTVFLESEEYGFETFDAEGWKDAMRIIREIYDEAKHANDGVGRKIGILFPGVPEDIKGNPMNGDED